MHAVHTCSGVVVSAEFRDAQETHESRVICLNQQMNSVSLKLTEVERQERQLREDLGTTIAAADEAALRAERQERQLREDLATTTAAAEEAALRAEERERELVSNCESLQRQRESEERERRAEADREAGAVAEVEILQARISELIREAHSVEPRHDPPSRSPPHYAGERNCDSSLWYVYIGQYAFPVGSGAGESALPLEGSGSCEA